MFSQGDARIVWFDSPRRVGVFFLFVGVGVVKFLRHLSRFGRNRLFERLVARMVCAETTFCSTAACLCRKDNRQASSRSSGTLHFSAICRMGGELQYHTIRTEIRMTGGFKSLLFGRCRETLLARLAL